MIAPQVATRLYRWMRTAREIDQQAQNLVNQNRAHFHISSAGHESMACLALSLRADDWIACHYRDKALLIAMGQEPEFFFRQQLAKQTASGSGRQLPDIYSEPSRQVLSMPTVVGNHALHAVGVAHVLAKGSSDSIVVCSVGDGTTQQGEVLEAIAEAVRWQLSVLFVVQDNHYSISTRTQRQTFFSLPSGDAGEFMGLPIQRISGADTEIAVSAFDDAVRRLRLNRQPQLIVLDVQRLSNHTNADDQRVYRSETEIQTARESGDPIEALRGTLKTLGTADEWFQETDRQISDHVTRAIERVLAEAEPVPTTEAKAPYPDAFLQREEYTGNSTEPRLSMREAIGAVLRHRLQSDPRVFLYGQDIEDPKGDVFGVTRGLSSAFPGRVVNAPLTESTIVGTSIGRALAGQRPVALIQFADFLPLAFNQLMSEMASMYWRTNGGWQCPVIVMATCGAYKPGLGPFHAQTMEGFAAHVPGIDVVMPSHAGDAAGLLNAAFESPRPTLFLYPKSCLNVQSLSTSTDVIKHFVLPGIARRMRRGSDMTLVTWGSPLRICDEACQYLEDAGFTVDLFDLRTITPWDKNSIIASVRHSRRLIVVHEDNQTGGFGAEIIATVIELAGRGVDVRRVARPDTFIPYHYGNQTQLLPGLPQILKACSELLPFDLFWPVESATPSGQRLIRANGSGPADEYVDVVSVCVSAGDRIAPGTVVAEFEATKSVVDLVSDCEGLVLDVNIRSGERIKVGSVVCRIAVHGEPVPQSTVTEESTRRPVIVRKLDVKTDSQTSTFTESAISSAMNADKVFHLCRPEVVVGGRDVATETIASGIQGWTAAEAVKRTGVVRRTWVSPEESSVSLTLQAARGLLNRLPTNLSPISAVFCSTTTPQEATPSIACSVATGLSASGRFSDNWFAVDLNAACSGFLYAVRLAVDHLAGNPGHSALVLTSELLSSNLNLQDPSTAFLFADAFTATLVTSDPITGRSLFLTRPHLRSMHDPDRVISSPCYGAGHLRMDGIAVARTAYKAMAAVLTEAATAAGLKVQDLAGVIPHPGSARILQNVAEILSIPADRLWHTLENTGNTSSSSIPVALNRYWDELPVDQPLGLVAFGAGFTSAATTGEMKVHD